MISTINVTPLRQHNDWYFTLDSATPKMKRYGVNDSDSFSDWLPNRRHRASATLWNISLTETLLLSTESAAMNSTINRFVILHDLVPPERDSLWLQHSHSGPNKTVGYSSFMNYIVTVSVTAQFYFILWLQVVHIGFSCKFHQLYFYLLVLVVFYIVTNLASQ